MLASEHWGIAPDIAVLGKGLGAGYAPIAATVASDDIIETIKRGSGVIMSGHTYSANPYCARAALEVLRYVKKHEPPPAVRGKRRNAEAEIRRNQRAAG